MDNRIRTIAVTLALCLAGTAQAEIIDFTDDSWSSNNPQDVGGVTVELLAFGPDGEPTDFTQQGFDGDKDNCGPLVCERDGIGIGDDEVSFGEGDKQEVERLLVMFSEGVDISAIFFLDLFGVGDDGTNNPETAQIQVNLNGAGIGFVGTAQDATGFFMGTSGNASFLSDPGAFLGVTELEFFADTGGSLISSANSDFALAGIELVSVPEPGTLALLGVGLLGMGFARRQRAR